MLGLLGSPPQVRGKRTPHATIHAHAGITPAGAGKTTATQHRVGAGGDHPRRCGENAVQIHRGRQPDGSPPQVRGKRCIKIRPRPAAGITPAGAGKTRRCSVAAGVRWDHPRRCGENDCRAGAATAQGGSPPQVRGKRCNFVAWAYNFGITPAGAGKTSTRRYTTSPTWDHPRRCGENTARLRGRGFQSGSPPQVRGKLHNHPQRQNRSGITPAGAGKTVGQVRARCARGDHPRRCGENPW